MKKHAAARARSFNCFNGKGTYASTSFKSISYFHAHCLTVDDISHSKKKANFFQHVNIMKTIVFLTTKQFKIEVDDNG